MIRRVASFMSALTIVLLPMAAHADGGWYGAFDLGQSRFDSGALQSLVPAGWPSTVSDHDTGHRFTGGYQFNSYWGLEASYTDLGSAKVYAKNPNPPIPDVPTYVQNSFDAKGWGLAGTGTYPFNDAWSVFGRLGMMRAQFHHQVQSDGLFTNPNVTDTAWKTAYGVGANWNFDRNWSLRLGYDWYRKLGNGGTTGEYNVGLLSLGVEYRFF
ncbi:MAG: outer membrane beta-barrel protein [Bacillota bacterium]